MLNLEFLVSRIVQGQSAIGPHMGLSMIDILRMYLCGSIKEVPKV